MRHHGCADSHLRPRLKELSPAMRGSGRPSRDVSWTTWNTSNGL